MALETYRGYVNTWECDDVGHMNVQFYMAKLDHALSAMRVHLGLGPTTARALGLVLRVREDHVHFRTELRASDALTMISGVEALGQDGMTIFTTVRDGVADTISATISTQLILERAGDGRPVPLPPGIAERARAQIVAVPAEAGPRSVGAAAGPLPDLSLDDALARPLIPTHFGVVNPAHCSADGRMLQAEFMARYSDGGGHLWAGVGMDRQSLNAKGYGVALVEYHQRYFTLPPAGTVIRVLSGLTAVGRKTVSFAHFMFNAESGAPIGRAEATGLLLDLAARRSGDLPEEDRARLIEIKGRHGLRP